MKELYRERDVVGNISAIKFGLMQADSMQQLSHIKVESNALYLVDEPTKPHPLGVLSRVMVRSTNTTRH